MSLDIKKTWWFSPLGIFFFFISIMFFIISIFMIINNSFSKINILCTFSIISLVGSLWFYGVAKLEDVFFKHNNEKVTIGQKIKALSLLVSIVSFIVGMYYFISSLDHDQLLKLVEVILAFVPFIPILVLIILAISLISTIRK